MKWWNAAAATRTVPDIEKRAALVPGKHRGWTSKAGEPGPRRVTSPAGVSDDELERYWQAGPRRDTSSRV